MEITSKPLCCAGHLITELRALLKEKNGLREEAEVMFESRRDHLRRGKNEARRLTGQRGEARKQRDAKSRPEKPLRRRLGSTKRSTKLIFAIRIANEKLGEEIENLKQDSGSLRKKAAAAVKARTAAAKTARSADNRLEKGNQEASKRDALSLCSRLNCVRLGPNKGGL